MKIQNLFQFMILAFALVSAVSFAEAKTVVCDDARAGRITLDAAGVSELCTTPSMKIATCKRTTFSTARQFGTSVSCPDGLRQDLYVDEAGLASLYCKSTRGEKRTSYSGCKIIKG